MPDTQLLRDTLQNLNDAIIARLREPLDDDSAESGQRVLTLLDASRKASEILARYR